MNKANTIASKKEVERFLSNTKFSGYQAINLPYNLKTPGMDRGESADLIFKDSVENKTLLDIGCKYGYFCQKAYEKGAGRITGIEITKENVDIAREIINLWNREIEIIHDDFMNWQNNQMYDITLFLNVLHHVESPVEVFKKIARITRELVIVEFPTILDSHTKLTWKQRVLYHLFFKKEPLIHLGAQQYHRLWYFSKHALTNLVITHLELFSRIEFEESPRKKGRVMAYCYK